MTSFSNVASHHERRFCCEVSRWLSSGASRYVSKSTSNKKTKDCLKHGGLDMGFALHLDKLNAALDHRGMNVWKSVKRFM